MKLFTAISFLILVGASFALEQKTKVTQETSTLFKDKATVSASADRDDLKETLVNLEKQSWEAWKNRDGKFFQDFLSDDHVELGFVGPMNKATVVRGVNSPMCLVKSYTVDRFELTQFDENTAVLTYHATQDTTCGGNPVPSPVWVSSLYVRRNGRWLNALYRQTQTKK